ncbi:hypothetical protein I3271_07165 [Photobacterium leiognathi]|uniref:hypothetical protein n=1 Tax=Photobacterium leiognathi TaxID=553611 RepID=UPI001EE0DECE|nr:hypothetical protein [Photobacterium leiognathi]MCG3884465.1 hypothetical protein [Photobacterium leiognathi]
MMRIQEGKILLNLLFTSIEYDNEDDLQSAVIVIDIPGKDQDLKSEPFKIYFESLECTNIKNALIDAINFVFTNDPLYRATPASLKSAKDWAQLEKTITTIQMYLSQIKHL